MSTSGGIDININERFSRLAHAPIVEAVIDLRAHARSVWEEAPLRERLESLLPDYEFIDSQRVFEHRLHMQAGKAPEQQVHDLGFEGMRFRSRNLPHIAVFNRSGFVFSRLSPYDGWGQFRAEALRLWAVHRTIADVTAIDRIGVRFINRILLSGENASIENYIDPHPDSPRGLNLPYVEYFQRDTFDVPRHPYALTIIRTVQPPQTGGETTWGLILDLDAFTKTGPFDIDPMELDVRLSELRWLKNKAFIGSISEQALAQMGKEVE